MTQPSPASLLSSPHTPVSNMTNTHTNGLQTQCCESAMEHGTASAYVHGQESFLSKQNADPEKRRHQRREIYSLMTDEQRDARLRKNRTYKRNRGETRTIQGHDDSVPMTDCTAATPRTNHAMHAQSSKHNQIGIVGSCYMYSSGSNSHISSFCHL